MPGRKDDGADLLASAISIARDVYKVKMDNKALDAANKLKADDRLAKTAEENRGFFEKWIPTKEGDPDAVSLRTPDGQDGLYKLRSGAEKQSELAYKTKKDEADRRHEIVLAGAKKDSAETKTTEGERLTAIYGQRLQQSNDIIAGLEQDADADLTGASGGIARMLPNSAQGKKTQMFEQAKRNFLNAALRKESGASISPDERASGELQYFPQYGDDPDTLAQKAANRQLVIDGFKTASGKAWENLNTTVADKKKESAGPSLEDLMAEKIRRQKQGTAQNK
jgi:hypothetical protein